MALQNFNSTYENDASTSVESDYIPIKIAQQWSIGNFGYFYQTKTVNFVESSTFSTEFPSDEQFNLRLYPKGCAADDCEYVSIFLYRKSELVKNKKLQVQCRISIVDQNVNKCHMKEFFEEYDTENNFYGFDIFMRCDDILKSNLLKNDSLTILCELNIYFDRKTFALFPQQFAISDFKTHWRVQNIFEFETHTKSITVFNEYTCKHKWTIGEFGTLKNHNPLLPFCIDFPSVYSTNYNRVQFKVKLYPDMIELENKRKDSAIKICLDVKSNELVDVKVHFKFIINVTDEEHQIVAVGKLNLASGDTSKWTKQFKKDQLYLKTQSLPNDAELKIIFSAQISLNPITTAVEVPTLCILNELNSKLTLHQPSDVVFVFHDNRKLFAHRCILVERSNIMEIEMKEYGRDETKISLTDVQLEVFDELLRFIYTGKAEVAQFAAELFKASLKYNLDELKFCCEEWLSENIIAISNALFLLSLARTHSSDKIKTSVVEYFHRKSNNLTKEMFKELRELKQELLIEIYPKLQPYLEGHMECDFTFQFVNGTKLYAHKRVIAGNSAVFEAMLLHDTIEKQEDIVDILDTDVDIFEHVLRFIYTGQILPLDDQTAFEVFIAADKYCLTELKSYTQKWIYSTMSVESVVEMLVLADRYNIAELKTKATNYFHQNANMIIKTEAFQLLLKNRSDLFVGLYLDILNKSTSKIKSLSEEDVSVL